MSGIPVDIFARLGRLALAGILALGVLFPTTAVTVTAGEGDRTLYFYHTHTKETGRFTYKRNGRWDQKALRELNVFLADWRTKEPTKMDPALFDLLWSVYRDVRATQPINVVSSYRAPETNAALRSKSSGVAKNSLHMKGQAIDFFIPGVNLSTLRESVMRHQVGGIGYYPTSGSPFVHADTGNVRAWPRMTRAQLKKVFPDGRTLHLPTDGKPLSNEGRRYAEAEWKKCRAVPCSGAPVGRTAPATMLASVDLEAPIPAVRPRGLVESLAQPARVQLASLGSDPEQRVVPTIDIIAPQPVARGAMLPGGIDENGAPIPAQKSQRVLTATLYTPPSGGETALSALDALGTPRPRVLMTDVVTAYAGSQDPEAEQALRMIIERETTASIPAQKTTPDPRLGGELQTASLGGAAIGGLKGMFDLTFSALGQSKSPAPMATALADLVESRQPNSSIELRSVEFVAPEIDHVNETLVHPVYMSGNHFAVMTEAEGYLDKGTELGPLTTRMAFQPAPVAELDADRFVVSKPLLLASR